MKINLKLNKIKFIPHQIKRFLNNDISSACAPVAMKNTVIFLCFVSYRRFH